MSDEGPATDGRSDHDGSAAPRSANGGTTDGHGASEQPAHLHDASGQNQGAPDTGEETSWALFARDIVTSALAVLLVGAYLFAVSGVWPPLVAIESGSMEPNMQTNDLVFVMSEERFHGDGAVNDTGVVTAESGEAAEYERFAKPGDVIVYEPNGQQDVTPIIHRAMLYVEKGEDWTKRANQSHLDGRSSCDEIVNCPADRAGFITKGDAVPGYDQVQGNGADTGTVSPDWVIGTAEVRVPGLGWLRLRSG